MALRQVACLKPNDTKAQCQLGIELNSLGFFQEAAVPIEIDPRFALAYYNRGKARRDKDDLDGSIVDYTAAIKINPPPELSLQ